MRWDRSIIKYSEVIKLSKTENTSSTQVLHVSTLVHAMEALIRCNNEHELQHTVKFVHMRINDVMDHMHSYNYQPYWTSPTFVLHAWITNLALNNSKLLLILQRLSSERRPRKNRGVWVLRSVQLRAWKKESYCMGCCLFLQNSDNEHTILCSLLYTVVWSTLVELPKVYIPFDIYFQPFLLLLQ